MDLSTDIIASEVVGFPYVLTTTGEEDILTHRFERLIKSWCKYEWLVGELEKPRGKTEATATGYAPARRPYSATATAPDSDEAWMRLQLAAEAGDERAFIEAAGMINWLDRTAQEFAEAVQLALAAGAHMMARRLAIEGARMYPENAVLAKMARVLAPPRFLGPTPSRPSTKANRQWLIEHAEAYRGKWVALKEGRLVAAGDSVAELKAQVHDLKGLMITRVS